MANNITLFQTAEGHPVYRTTDRMGAAHKAIKKAMKQGQRTLLAIEPDGRRFDYTDLLNRYQTNNGDLL